jgi:hypothetical protein
MKMDAVRNQFNRPLVVGIASFIIGVLIGLISGLVALAM